MSNVAQFPKRRDERLAEAADWIARLGNGLSEDEEQELGEWMSLDRENYEQFMELAILWDEMESLSRLAEIFPEPQRPHRMTAVRASWAVAATVVVGLSIALFYWVRTDLWVDSGADVSGSFSAEYETGIGEQVTHSLVDGTQIVLNTNSALTVEYTESNRLLNLLRGEVNISVASDKSRPLSVMVGDKVVQAIGTEFNLEITSDQTIELVVTEGIVMVGVLDGAVDEASVDKPLILTPASRLVAAGQEYSFDADEQGTESAEANPIDSGEIAVRLSWRNGNLIFRGEPLEDAVNEVGRYTAVQFVFLDEESKKVRVAGHFRAGDVEGLLAALREHFNISYEWQGDDKIVLRTE